MTPSGFGPPEPVPRAPAARSGQELQPIDSRQLMQGARMVEIAHEGTV